MSFRLLSLLPLFAFTSAEEAAGNGIPLVNGNLGLTGGGYGDVYGGKVSENVYGAGGRANSVSSLLGLGSGRKKRQDFGFVPFASLSIVPPVAEERRKRQIATADASAFASADGGNAVANAAASASVGKQSAAPAAEESAAPAAGAEEEPVAEEARKKRQDFGFVPIASLNGPLVDPVPFASLNIAPPAAATETTVAPEEARKRRQVATANAFASASADGGNAVANAAASASVGEEPAAPAAEEAADEEPAAEEARKKRQDFGFVPFASLGVVPISDPIPPAAAATTAAPAATTAAAC